MSSRSPPSGMSAPRCPSFVGRHRLTRPPQVLLVLPRPTAAGLARDDQVEARHEGHHLAAGARLEARVPGNAPAAAEGRQLPTVRVALRVLLKAQLLPLHVV